MQRKSGPNNKASHPGGHALAPAPTAQSSVPLELQRLANPPPSSEISLGPKPAEDGKWEGRSPACAGRRGIRQSPKGRAKAGSRDQKRSKKAGKLWFTIMLPESEHVTSRMWLKNVFPEPLGS